MGNRKGSGMATPNRGSENTMATRASLDYSTEGRGFETTTSTGIEEVFLGYINGATSMERD
jgi:hypothetical protein